MSVGEPLLQAALMGEALDNGPTLVFVADESMRYLAVNKRACDVLGYTRDELLALRVTDVAVHDEASGEYGEMVESGRREGTCELRRADGSSVRFRYTAAQTTIGGIDFFVSVGVVD